MFLTQAEYNVAKQTSRSLYSKIVLLSKNFEQIGELTGNVIGNPSFSISSDSDIRRTCSISLIPTDSSFDIDKGNKIWFDKYIQIYMGIRETHNDEIIWTNMGVYIINDPSRAYSADDNTLSFQASDLMALLTTMRGGVYSGVDYVIPQGSNIRDVMIATLKEAGIKKYDIYAYNLTVPNDIRVARGTTAYELLNQLVELYPHTQIYFDVDGVFRYGYIPYDDSNQMSIVANDDLWKDVLIDYNISNDFQNVKNHIYVYGTTHNVGSNYADGVAKTTINPLSRNVTLGIAGVNKYTDGMLIGFTVDKEIDTFNSKLFPEYTFSIEYEDVVLDKKVMKGRGYLFVGEYYVAKYVADIDETTGKDNGYFQYLGHLQAKSEASETSSNSPFSINEIGDLAIVLEGGDYDNLYTDADCYNCAKYELYNRCKIYDGVQINCVPVYWLDVNEVVEITLPNKYGKKITARYLVNNISISDTQSISLTRLY
nr:MAG TPA: tail protein [Caudoviricetes sp.]